MTTLEQLADENKRLKHRCNTLITYLNTSKKRERVLEQNCSNLQQLLKKINNETHKERLKNAENEIQALRSIIINIQFAFQSAIQVLSSIPGSDVPSNLKQKIIEISKASEMIKTEGGLKTQIPTHRSRESEIKITPILSRKRGRLAKITKFPTTANPRRRAHELTSFEYHDSSLQLDYNLATKTEMNCEIKSIFKIDESQDAYLDNSVDAYEDSSPRNGIRPVKLEENRHSNNSLLQQKIFRKLESTNPLNTYSLTNLKARLQNPQKQKTELKKHKFLKQVVSLQRVTEKSIWKNEKAKIMKGFKSQTKLRGS